ncbi:MAG TPA: Fe-S cluster assembly protein SufD [Nevskiaceae bacterium]|nr:Fe-S cluster assembly protein SufD [Nevskiaceae bacterium]
MSASAKGSAALAPWRSLFEKMAPDLGGDLTTRRAQLEAFLATGLPNRHEELWKYTEIPALAQAHAPADDASTLALPSPLPGTSRIMFVNGRCVEGSSWVGTVAPSDTLTSDRVVSLNAAFAATGAVIDVAAGQQVTAAFHLLLLRDAASAANASHLCHRITLGENAAATVIVETRGAGQYFGTDVLEVSLAAGAQLALYRIQDSAAAATELASSRVSIGRDAKLDAYSFDLGAGLARHDFNIVLDAPGAELALQSLSVTNGRAHADNHVRVEHRAPHGRSRINFRGIAGDHSRLVFDGLIYVGKGAVKTDSDQRLASLLLSSKAEVDAKPELEIYNDDVRCDHGTATGQLDPLALFYLRSRGLSEAHARELLTLAFAATVLESVPLEALREHLRSRATERLRDVLAGAVATGSRA